MQSMLNMYFKANRGKEHQITWIYRVCAISYLHRIFINLSISSLVALSSE